MATAPGAAGPGAPFPQWFVDAAPGSGHTANEVTNAATKAFAISVSFPDKLVFFTSKAAAQAYANTLGGSVSVPGTAGLAQAGQGALNAGGQTVTDAASVGDFLGRLEEPQTWLRVVEVVIGAILLIVAIEGMTKPITAPATRAASKGVGKIAKAGVLLA